MPAALCATVEDDERFFRENFKAPRPDGAFQATMDQRHHQFLIWRNAAMAQAALSDLMRFDLIQASTRVCIDARNLPDSSKPQIVRLSVMGDH